KTVEDLAGCATDDLAGWTERKDGESKREPGILDGIEISREEAEAIVMQARLKAGWISEADLAPPPAAAEEAHADAQPKRTTPPGHPPHPTGAQTRHRAHKRPASRNESRTEA